jgi:TPR repeat protein
MSKVNTQRRRPARAGLAFGLAGLWLGVLGAVGVGCSTDEAAQAPGPPLRPATGGLGTVADEPMRIEVLRTVEAALADLDEHGTRSDEGQVLTPDWRRARALGAWVSATLLARAVHDGGVAVDPAALERAALPFTLSAERHLSPADSAERARIDRVARRLALRLVAGPALLDTVGDASAPSSGTRHFFARSYDEDGPVVEVLIGTFAHPDEGALRRRAPSLGEQARRAGRTWTDGASLTPGVVVERRWLTPSRAAAGLRTPLFAAAPGTVVGPVRVPSGMAIAKVVRRHASGAAGSGPRAQQAMEDRALRALDASLWAGAEVTLDDIGLQRWLSATDLGPDGIARWQNPCTQGAKGERCAALNRLLGRTADPSRFVAAPREALLNACDGGDRDACVAVADDRGLSGAPLATLWAERQGCNDPTWSCERASLLGPLAATPLASAPRTLVRLARRCAVWDPRTCPRFAALLDELRTPVASGVARPPLPEGPLAWALVRGCARSADVVTCHVARTTRPSVEERALLCFQRAGAERAGSGRALRAAACADLAQTTSDREGQRMALNQACTLGQARACHQAAQAALAAGALDEAVARARAALEAPGGERGPEAATSLRLIAADTGCTANDADACAELAEHVLAAGGEEGRGLARATGLLTDACRTSAAACWSATRLALRPEAPDIALAMRTATAACRGGEAQACQTSLELREMTAACPPDDDRPADCRALAGLFLDDDAEPATQERGLRLLDRGCRAGDAWACDAAVRSTLTSGGGLRAALSLCQQPAAANVDRCARLRMLPAKEQACRGGRDEVCVELGQLLLRMEGPPADRAQGRELLDKACRQGGQAACAALLGGDAVSREVGLRATCARPSPDGPSRGCAALVQHLRLDTRAPRAAEALPVAEQACGTADGVACRLLGEMWMSGEGGAWSIRAARSAWDEGCRAGDRKSCGRARAWADVEP